eukprot:4601005-Heterocapsa_arctica.AAC.1
MKQLGWTDNTPTNITDHKNQTRNLDDWRDLFMMVSRELANNHVSNVPRTGPITKELKEE